MEGCPTVQRAEDAQAGAILSFALVLVYCSCCKLQAPLKTRGACGGMLWLLLSPVKVCRKAARSVPAEGKSTEGMCSVLNKVKR